MTLLDPLEGHGEAILRPDGTTPDSPLADADSQAAAVAALRALARTDADNAGHWNGLRSELQRRISDVFGSTVLALEADNSPVLGARSQLGWLLWADALDASASEEAARRLQQKDVLTPFGVRTLSSDHPQFNAHAYHRGSVWPFDNWLTWGGLRAAGHPAAAEKVRRGVMAAIRTLGRAPELYAVNENGDLEPISRANRVQAWTSEPPGRWPRTGMADRFDLAFEAASVIGDGRLSTGSLASLRWIRRWPGTLSPSAPTSTATTP